MKGAVLNLPASRPGPDVSLFPDAAHCYHCNALHLSRPVGTGAFLRKASLSPRLGSVPLAFMLPCLGASAGTPLVCLAKIWVAESDGPRFGLNSSSTIVV